VEIGNDPPATGEIEVEDGCPVIDVRPARRKDLAITVDIFE
jgi:hypothetical protein